MKVSLRALTHYFETNATPKELADKLTSIGLEVEEVIDKAAALADFTVAEIKSVENHPNADRLHVLTVFTGTEDLQIVCGAPNVRVGLKSVLARPGVFIRKTHQKHHSRR